MLFSRATFFSAGLVHPCGLCCPREHRTGKGAINHCSQDLVEAMWGTVPASPACNKYYYIYPALSWATLRTHLLPGIGINSYDIVARRKLVGSDAADDAQDAAHAHGRYETAAAYSIKEKVRLRKSLNWIMVEDVRNKLFSATISLKV